MPSQCFALGFSPRLANTDSRRSTCPCVSRRWLSNAVRSAVDRAAFTSFGSALRICFSAS